MGRVKGHRLPDVGTSEQDLATKFCNFFVDKITDIRDRLKGYNSFVLENKRKTGMLEFN